MSRAYYNEIDPNAAAWLRQLIAEGHIAPGDVDTRSIADVIDTDLKGYTQCHFFAGIGVWSYALRQAGWPDDQPVWTGSCPCQPFSVAGRKGGTDDNRHLWPWWHCLIAECKPPVVFGEQVASPDGLQWLDIVSTDLEGEGYAVGAADLCAAGVGAPHARSRLWFVAESNTRTPVGDDRCGCWSRDAFHRTVGMRPREVCVNHPRSLVNSDRERAERVTGSERRKECTPQSGREDEGRRRLQAVDSGSVGSVGNANGKRLEVRPFNEIGCGAIRIEGQAVEQAGATRGFWGDCDWLWHTDGAYRAVEPGTFPLAHGAPARVGRLRGYGNAIVPQVAKAFIAAYVDTLT